ncbi:PASTA domain-containing protein [Melissospora conviva]|uniref:PASTA domain-containing protein n=1 Tax=Melissospora conviva TaxID=3388432 RepID=UPI003C1D4990
MEDDRPDSPQQRPDGAGDHTRPLPPSHDPDATGAMPPVDGGDQTQAMPPVDGGDRTQAMPPVDGGDRTQAMPPVDGGDQTQAMPPVDRGDTQAMPPVGAGEEGGPGGAAVWSGRAEVRPPQAEEAEEVWYPQDEPGRRWWMPILIGVVVLVLLAALGTGLWLILGAAGDSEPDPAPVSPTATRSATPATSAPPTTRGPATPSAPATTTALVQVPAVVGWPVSAAQTAMSQAGLGYRVRLEESGRPAGTVLRAEPSAGSQVPTGTEIVLVVAAEPTAAPTAEPTAPAPPSPTGATASPRAEGPSVPPAPVNPRGPGS